MGQLFWMSTKFAILGFFAMRKPQKSQNVWKIGQKWPYFSRKILKNGYPFWPNSPLKMGMGFEAWAAHPCPTQIWVPPRVRCSQLHFMESQREVQKTYAQGTNEHHFLSFSYISMYSRGDQRAKLHWMAGQIWPVDCLLRTPAITQGPRNFF